MLAYAGICPWAYIILLNIFSRCLATDGFIVPETVPKMLKHYVLYLDVYFTLHLSCFITQFLIRILMISSNIYAAL